MKKIIFSTIILCLIIVIVSMMLYFYYSADSFNIQVVEVSKIFTQSILSGIVTFTGLFFTVMAQEIQQKMRCLEELCPCFVVACQGFSAKKELSDSGDHYNIRVADGSLKVRDVDGFIKNAKGNFALNVTIYGENKEFYLGYMEKEKEKVGLVLNAENPGEFIICFEDICGNKYKQKITYKYDGNKYCFWSERARRIKKYEKKYK